MAAHDGALWVRPGAAPALACDADGNGSFESPIPPTVDASGPRANDLAPPKLEASVLEEDGTIVLTLRATDSGTGVKAVSYSPDGRIYQPYTGLIRIAGTRPKNLYAFRDDNVGNRAALVFPVPGGSPGGGEVSLPFAHR